MIIIGGLFLWTALFVLVYGILWVRMAGPSRIYLLILADALFLTGIFWLFPFLKNMQ